jgi:hypothetical protein
MEIAQRAFASLHCWITQLWQPLDNDNDNDPAALMPGRQPSNTQMGTANLDNLENSVSTLEPSQDSKQCGIDSKATVTATRSLLIFIDQGLVRIDVGVGI